MGNIVSVPHTTIVSPAATVSSAPSAASSSSSHASIHARMAKQLHVGLTPIIITQNGSGNAPMTNNSTTTVGTAVHSTAVTSSSSSLTSPSHTTRPPCACAHFHPGKSCLSYLFSSFGRSFYLAYGIRAGISLALHVMKLLRSNQKMRVFDLNQLVSANGLPIDAVRIGLFMGGFTGIYNGLRCAFARFLGWDNSRSVALAGFFAGLSILFHDPDSHRTLALYVWARVAQCWYNRAKAQGKWHFWASNWEHGDSLLFSVCTAQVMYAYVMRPDTLPPAYFKFIAETGPIPYDILKASQLNNRGLPLDMDRIRAVYQRLAPPAVAAAKPIDDILSSFAVKAYGPGASPALPPLLPCALLHPHNPSCSHQWVETWVNTAKRILPLYLSLTFVPMFILRFWLLVKHPIEQIRHGLWSVTKSTSFLATFTTAYMFVVCMHRRAFTQDHRSLYWFSGFIAAWSILLEQKSRRSELALYCLPRTIDSLIQTLQSRKLLADIPHGEKLLFCSGMAALMYYREHHPDSMSPLLRRVLNFFVPSYKSMPAVPGTTIQVPALPSSSTVTSSPSTHQQQQQQQQQHGDVDLIVPHPSHPDDASRMLRSDSDGLSFASVNGVIPLPSPGICYSREQSNVNLQRMHDAAGLNVSGASPSPSSSPTIESRSTPSMALMREEASSVSPTSTASANILPPPAAIVSSIVLPTSATSSSSSSSPPLNNQTTTTSQVIYLEPMPVGDTTPSLAAMEAHAEEATEGTTTNASKQKSRKNKKKQ